MKKDKYELKNFKGFPGTDYPGFAASLYREGKRIGTVADYGNGAELEIDVSEQEMVILGKQVGNESIDTFICKLADEYETNKKLKRMCKNKTVFIVKEEIFSIGVPFDERVKALILKKYENAEIVNERFAV